MMLRHGVEKDIIDQGENEDHLHEAADALPEDHGNRFVLTEQQRAGHHEENGNGSLDPEGHQKIQRKPRGGLLRKIQRKSGRGGMGEHDEPYAEDAKKFDVNFFALRRSAVCMLGRQENRSFPMYKIQLFPMVPIIARTAEGRKRKFHLAFRVRL